MQEQTETIKSESIGDTPQRQDSNDFSSENTPSSHNSQKQDKIKEIAGRHNNTTFQKLLTSTKLLGGFKGFGLPDEKDKKLSNKKPKIDIMDKLRMTLNKSLTSN